MRAIIGHVPPCNTTVEQTLSLPFSFDLISLCWKADRTLRPSMRDIIAALRNALYSIQLETLTLQIVGHILVLETLLLMRYFTRAIGYEYSSPMVLCMKEDYPHFAIEALL